MGEMGSLSQIVPIFSDFSPVSYQFHTFFLHSPQCIIGNLPQFPKFPPFPPMSPHFPPFPPISPHFPPFPPIPPPFSPIFPFPPFSFTSAASWLIPLRLPPMPAAPTSRGRSVVTPCAPFPVDFVPLGIGHRNFKG